MTDTARTAVLFRTHFWDAFAQRQFDRLLAVSSGTDVFVLVDETNGAVHGITHPDVVRVTEDGLLGMGFARAGTGNLLWFNGDYPLYRFQELHPDYDYYVQLEYDVLINQPISELVERLRREHVDYVGLTKGEAGSVWFWRNTMAQAYAPATVRNQLICVCAFSASALRHLWQARLAQSEAVARRQPVRMAVLRGIHPHRAGPGRLRVPRAERVRQHRRLRPLAAIPGSRRATSVGQRLRASLAGRAALRRQHAQIPYRACSAT